MQDFQQKFSNHKIVALDSCVMWHKWLFKLS